MWVARIEPPHPAPRARPAAFGLLAVEFIEAPAVPIRIEHLQGSAAGVDLVVMGEIGEPFEDAEQVFVPGAAPDLHIAGATLRAERAEPRQLVATLGCRRHGEGTEHTHQVQRLALAGLPWILAEPGVDALAVNYRRAILLK